MAKSLDSADLESVSSCNTAPGGSNTDTSVTDLTAAQSKEDGIAMDVYRAFISSAK